MQLSFHTVVGSRMKTSCLIVAFEALDLHRRIHSLADLRWGLELEQEHIVEYAAS